MDRSTPPKLSFNPHIAKLDYNTLKLNGVTPFYYIQDNNQAICGIEIVFGGGKIDESIKGASFFSTHLLKSGINGYDSNAINEFFELRGAFIQVQAGLDYNSISLYCLSDKLDETLEFFLMLFNQPTFPKNQIAKLIKKKEQELEINEQKSNYWAGKLIKKALFKQHPYGQVLNQKELKSITTEKLLQHWNENSLNSIQFITAVGNFNLVNLTRGLEKNISKPKIKPTNFRNEIIPDNTSSYINKPLINNEQASLKIGINSINMSHQDYSHLSLANTIFGGYFGSRLMQTIREDKGLTYGINSSIIHLVKSSYIQISADVKFGAGQEVLELIKLELARLVSNSIDEQELKKVISYLVGEYKSNSETIFDKMNRIKLLKIHKLTDDFYIKHFNSILNTNSRGIQQVIEKHFFPQSFKTVLVE